MNFAAIFPLYKLHLFKNSGKNFDTQYPIPVLLFKSIEYKCAFLMSFIAFNIIIELPQEDTPTSKIFLGLNFLIIPFKNSL